MSGLNQEELVGLLRIGKNDGRSVSEWMQEDWGQDYDEIIALAVHTTSPIAFSVGVELGLRLATALRDLERINNA